MAVILTEERHRDAEGVTLAQLAEIVEHALKECEHRAVDASTVTPKTIIRLGGRIRKIEISI